MLAYCESRRMDLECSSEPNRQQDLVLQIDSYFQRYDLEIEPADAVSVATLLGYPNIADYIEQINKFLYDSNKKDSFLHRVRIGRMFGVRVVTIDLFKGTFPDADDLADQIELKASFCGATSSGIEEGPNGVEVWARWG